MAVKEVRMDFMRRAGKSVSKQVGKQLANLPVAYLLLFYFKIRARHGR